MAKRGILEHEKTIELASILGIPEIYAVGVLEVFWQWVAKYRPTGDLTGLKPEVLAKSIRYPGDGQSLIEALLKCRLIDQLSDGRALVHDWSEHADNAVHQRLKKSRQRFADGAAPFSRTVLRSQSDGSQTIHKPVTNGSVLPEPEPEPEPERSIAREASPEVPPQPTGNWPYRKTPKAENETADDREAKQLFELLRAMNIRWITWDNGLLLQAVVDRRRMGLKVPLPEILAELTLLAEQGHPRAVSSLEALKRSPSGLTASPRGYWWATEIEAWKRGEGIPRNPNDPYLPQTNTMTEEEERALLARAQEAHDAYVAQTQAEV